MAEIELTSDERSPRPTKQPRGTRAPLLTLALDPDAAEPLYRQLYTQVREAVLSGRLAPGVRLPATRALAEELGCSRNTVLNAFDQLLAEGYLEGQTGSGTYVSRVLPEDLLSVGGADPGPQPSRPAAARGLSQRGTALAALRRFGGSRGGAFATGLPDLSLFPFDVWGRLLGQCWRRPRAEVLRATDPAGYPPLRAAIAQYLRAARGLDCGPDQVLVTAGGQQAIDLAARLLLDPGDPVWVEDPGYPGLRGAMIAAGAQLVPVPVDREGLSVDEGCRRAATARLAAVTPSHHYPLGVTMSLGRRLALLDWARANDAWILEDDYDSEYRFSGRPLASLQGLDAERAGGERRVIYVGTFSKVLFPALRLGYLVVPPDLAEALAQARSCLDDHPSAIAQPALARFIEEGHFAAHLRRMRRLYAARQAALVEAGRRHLQGLLDLVPEEAGLHMVARLSPDLVQIMTDREAAARAKVAGITVTPLSDFALEADVEPGLMLGYAAVPEDQIEAGAERLAQALTAASKAEAGPKAGL